MFKKKTSDKNFLKFIPKRSEKITSEEIDGLVTLIIPRDKLLESLVRKIMNTPKYTKIQLDALGSGVWKNIDDKTNVGEIAQKLEAEFGEKAKPLYKRLVHFMKVLNNNDFIRLEGRE